MPSLYPYGYRQLRRCRYSGLRLGCAEPAGILRAPPGGYGATAQAGLRHGCRGDDGRPALAARSKSSSMATTVGWPRRRRMRRRMPGSRPGSAPTARRRAAPRCGTAGHAAGRARPRRCARHPIHSHGARRGRRPGGDGGPRPERRRLRPGNCAAAGPRTRRQGRRRRRHSGGRCRSGPVRAGLRRPVPRSRRAGSARRATGSVSPGRSRSCRPGRS